MERTITMSCEDKACEVYYEAFLNKEMLPSGFYVVEVETGSDFISCTQTFKLKKAGKRL